MAKRYGRNQRRAHRAEIEALRAKLYGIWGEPPAHLQRIDHLPYVSLDVEKCENSHGITETVTISYYATDYEIMEVFRSAYERSDILVYGDMCLLVSGVECSSRDFDLGYGDSRHARNRIIGDYTISVEFNRVRAPKEH